MKKNAMHFVGGSVVLLVAFNLLDALGRLAPGLPYTGWIGFNPYAETAGPVMRALIHVGNGFLALGALVFVLIGVTCLAVVGFGLAWLVAHLGEVVFANKSTRQLASTDLADRIHMEHGYACDGSQAVIGDIVDGWQVVALAKAGDGPLEGEWLALTQAEKDSGGCRRGGVRYHRGRVVGAFEPSEPWRTVSHRQLSATEVATVMAMAQHETALRPHIPQPTRVRA